MAIEARYICLPAAVDFWRGRRLLVVIAAHRAGARILRDSRLSRSSHLAWLLSVVKEWVCDAEADLVGSGDQVALDMWMTRGGLKD